MSPIWMDKPIEQMTQAELRATMIDGRASEELRDKAGLRLGDLQEAASMAARAYDAQVRRARRVYASTQGHKASGAIDPRSVSYAIKRSAWSIGKVWGSVTGAIAGYAFLAQHLGLPALRDMIRDFPAACLIGGLLVAGWGLALFALQLLGEARGTFRRDTLTKSRRG